MHAHEIMSRHVITVSADTPVTAAIRIMLSHHISGLPVVDTKGRLTGIVSEAIFSGAWKSARRKGEDAGLPCWLAKSR